MIPFLLTTMLLLVRPCNNQDCLYLHDFGSPEDSFSKDDIDSAFTTYVLLGVNPPAPPLPLCASFLLSSLTLLTIFLWLLYLKFLLI